MKKEKSGLVLAIVISMLVLIPSVSALTTCVNCSDCNQMIKSATSGDVVMLTANITNCDGNCIEFNGKDGITFDGGGHIISGDGDYSGFGIYLSTDSDDNTLKNCKITGFRYGIELFKASNNTIQNITAYSNVGGGITIFYSTANTIRDCILQKNSHYDFHFRPYLQIDCDNRLINVTGSGGRPIEFYNQSVNLQDQEFSALYLCNADNSVLNNITIRGSDSLKNNGLRLFYTDNSNLTDIVSSNNFGGVLLDNANTNKLQNIKCNNNHHQGIHVCSCSFNTLERTETNSNTQCGIYLSHSSSNKLTNITSRTNSFAGVYVDRSSSTIINNSYIRNNVGMGININNAGANLIHNNYFCNVDNINFAGTTVYANDWNISKISGTNIISGSWLGGNYWATPSGTGFSEMCTDTDGDGICDAPYILTTNDIDHLPLVPVSTVQFETELESGWNLISVPLTLTSWQLGAESVVGDPLIVTPKNSITSIYRYDTTSCIFDKCDHFAGLGWWPATGSESFTELEPDRGYWVMAKNDCTLTFTGTAPSDLDVALNTSWNLIGWHSMEEALLGQEALVGDPLNVTPKNSLTSIYRYNTSEGEFEKCDHFDNLGWWPATGSESFTRLEPGSGYWVMAKNDCVWRH